VTAATQQVEEVDALKKTLKENMASLDKALTPIKAKKTK
jgi:hypothetical protein